MALQSSGAISIADVVAFTRASASVVKPFSLGPVTQRSLSFYYNQAFVVPSTFTATYNNVGGNSAIYNSTNTGSSPQNTLTSSGNIISIHIPVGHGSGGEAGGFILSVSLELGTYKIGSRWGNTGAPSSFIYSLLLSSFSLGHIYSNTTLAGGSLRDSLSTFTIPSNQSLSINHGISNPNAIDAGYTSDLYVNIFRVS